MADIHKLTNVGELIYPATVSDAVVHPQIKNSLTKLIYYYDISTLFPTSGISNGDTYNAQEAILLLSEKLKESEKVLGVKIGFLNTSRIHEEWEYIGNGFPFSNKSGWMKVGAGVIQTILQKLFPLTVNLSCNQSIVRVNYTYSANLSWSVVRQGVDVTGLATKTLNGTLVTGNKISVSGTPASHETITYSLTAEYDGMSVSTSRSLVAVHPSYSGIITDKNWIPSDADLTQKVNRLALRGGRSWTWGGINLNDARPCIAYPQYFGKLTSIKDGNNFEYINSYTLYPNCKVEDTPYFVYILTDPTTVNDIKQIYS